LRVSGRKFGFIAAVLGVVAALGASAGPRDAQGKSNWTLDDLLKQLDMEAKSFHALSANVERTKVTVVVARLTVDVGRAASMI